MAAAVLPLAAAARQDEPLDSVLWRTLGRTDGAVEAVLDADPTLAALPARLPEGRVVIIPAAAQAPAPAPLQQLWD